MQTKGAAYFNLTLVSSEITYNIPNIDLFSLLIQRTIKIQLHLNTPTDRHNKKKKKRKQTQKIVKIRS